MSEETYKLDELARAAGVSARTVRYYVQRGLLPPPTFRGKDTAYGREHRLRLQAIRRLQDAYFPLDAIAVELERRSLDELERLASGAEVPAQSTSQIEPPLPSKASETFGTSSLEARAKTYQRIELLPGVELFIASDAPAASRRAAERIALTNFNDADS